MPAQSAALTDMQVETPDALSPRQIAVLSATLDALVEQGPKLTMAAVAREASCSKETLYAWFGNREGLLAATVRWYAGQVRVPPFAADALDADSLRAVLTTFAVDLLSVLSSPKSVALNRAGIAMASQHDASEGGATLNLGQIVLQNGRLSTGPRLKVAIEAGQKAGLLDASADAEEAFSTFFGLVVRDVQIRLLLGDTITLSKRAIAQQAATATNRFFKLYARDILASGTTQTPHNTSMGD